jgi:uncharacterized protein (TIGR03435 family)
MVRALAGVCLAVFLSVPVLGQSDKPVFDTADVHAVAPTQFGDNMSGGVLRAGRYDVRSATMVDLVRLAYGVDSEHVLGGPGWLDTDRFDVLAKAPAEATPESAKLMLQALLADRFSLAVRNDTRPVPVYVLSIGKGNKMKAASGSGAPGCQSQQQGAPVPLAPGQIPPNIVVSCHGMSMDVFAEQVRQMAGAYLDHPVLNQTKLEGEWDFDLTWTGRNVLAAAGSDGISIFDAVDKQLGLKIEAQKTPQPVVIVEKVNEKPTANAPGVPTEVVADAEFEAAEVKPADPSQPPRTMFIYQPGGRIDGQGTLSELVGMALGITPNLHADTLVGMPKFADTARYEIIAKTPTTGAGAATHDGSRDTPPPLSVALVMLHNFMNERFKLATHTENREATVYALTVPKSGVKLQKSDGTQRSSCRPDQNAAPASSNGTPSAAMRCVNTTMSELVKGIVTWAPAYVDHPVVDATGLTDGYDFVLTWTPKGALHPAQPGATASGAAVDPGGLSVFEAVERELGLKLDVQKRSIPVIVIDHLEEKPIDN